MPGQHVTGGQCCSKEDGAQCWIDGSTNRISSVAGLTFWNPISVSWKAR